MRNRLSAFFRNLRQDRRGLALTELALVVPMLSVLTLGTVDYSMMVLARLTVQTAARTGAEYAVENGYNSTNIASAITATSNRGGLVSSIAASPAPTQWFGCPNATTGVATAVSATTVCSTGKTAGTYVTAAAQATYTFILPWPYAPPSSLLTASSTVRIN